MNKKTNDEKVILQLQDFRHLQWTKIRHSSGTAGSFLKASARIRGERWYYKLSDYDPYRGIVGHECVNEIIADRLLTILRIPLSVDSCLGSYRREGIRDMVVSVKRLQTERREQDRTGYLLSDGKRGGGIPSGFLFSSRMGTIYQ